MLRTVTGAVATFVASDPEGVSYIGWSLATNIDLDGDGTEDVVAGDITDADDFKISSDGVLSFMSSPNFETPVGGVSDDSNTYRVVVQASDGTEGDYFKVIVTVTNVDEPGKVTWTVAPSGTASPGTDIGLLQFRSGARLTAIVTDSDGVTSPSWKWYRSSSRSETGTAISGETEDNYLVSDSPTNNDVGSYIRVEATYRENATSSTKTVSFVSENPVLASRGNRPPTFASATVGRRIAENAAAGDPVGGPVTATDTDGDILTYSLSGTNAANFAINRATGQLTVKAGANIDHDTAATQGVTVTVNDPSGNVPAGTAIVTTTVTITISDVNEAPEFAGSTETVNMKVVAIAENADALTIGGYSATDPDGDSPSLSLMGADANLFELAANTGDSPTVSRILSFKASPDFDMPDDQGRNNVYEVTVRASDGGNNADLKVVVKVTDFDEDGEVTLSSQDAQIGVELTATLSDEDGGVPNAAQFTDQKWTWLSATSVDLASASVISGATSSTYTPTGGDDGAFLGAMVTYTDRHGMKTVSSDATREVRAAATNQAPKFSEGASTLRIVMENAGGDDANVGSVVEATDANDDALAYTLGGADAALFSVTRLTEDDQATTINETGQPQISVKSTTELDYETKSSYTVTITANDGSDASNATAMITVKIYVTDVDEEPKVAGPQTVTYAENGTGQVARFTARDPEGATPTQWSLATATVDDIIVDGDITDADDFKISSDGVLSFMSSPNFEAPAGGISDNSSTYMVTVVASDGTKDGYYKVLVTVTNVEEPGKVTWTVAPSGSANPSTDIGLPQFRSGARLTATVTDGDGVTSPSWKWYRGSSVISGETAETYLVLDDDIGMRIRAEASYRENQNSPIKTVSFVSENPVMASRTTQNNPPTFASSTADRRIAENAAAGDSVGGPVTATDADGDTLAYSIPSDTANFAINSATGRLTVKAGANLDHDATATQVVMVTATDPAGATVTTTVTITISDVNEAPEFAGSTETVNMKVVAIAENADALTIGGYSATDPDGDSPSLSLMGADANLFELAANTGDSPTVSRILSFKASPDFDMPDDQGRNNVYEVTVRASDGGNNADLKVVVKVTDFDEDGEVTLSSQDAQIGVELTATLSDEDGGVPNAARFTDQKWVWLSATSVDLASASVISGATSSTYTPTGGDDGAFLGARVTYTDRHGMKTLDSDATRAVRAAATNQAPKFSEGASTLRIVMENAGGDDANVGSVVEATDVNDDALAYTLGGADAALFSVTRLTEDDQATTINETGQPQISVKSTTELDYETKSSYTVTITANDGSGTSNATAMITVNIYVTDMDEAPTIMVGDVSADLSISGPASPVYAENGTAPVATYMLAGTNAASATWSLEGDDAEDFNISGGMLRFVSSPDYEMPADANGDNTYMVTVKASDGTDMDTYEVTVTVTNEDEEGQADDLLETYDTNDNNRIDKREALTAIEDYIFGGILTKEQALEVITLYIFGSS